METLKPHPADLAGAKAKLLTEMALEKLARRAEDRRY